MVVVVDGVVVLADEDTVSFSSTGPTTRRLTGDVSQGGLGDQHRGLLT